jgi:hypothetical protein
MVEWTVLAFVILAFGLVFGRQVQDVQGQAELAAVKFTLGALRTTLVVDHLKRAIEPGVPSAARRQYNPFLLLERVPPNFVGNLARSQAIDASPGTWFFDPECVCAGYRLLYPQWLDLPANTEVIWFRIGSTEGPLLLTPLNRYVWRGEEIW